MLSVPELVANKIIGAWVSFTNSDYQANVF